MSKRDLLLLNGLPGSGTSRLGESLAEYCDSPMRTVEHVSVGDRVRAIGQGAIESLYGSHVVRHLEGPTSEEPLDDEIIRGIVEEIFQEYADTTDLLLLDGYPRNIGQVADVLGLARRHDRSIRGVILTHTDELTAKARMLGRTTRPISEEAAERRIELYTATAPSTLQALGKRALDIVYIDTTGEKASTTEAGLRALAGMVRPTMAEVPM